MLHSCDRSETVRCWCSRTVSQFKTRPDGGQFTQPARIFSGITPWQKADSENQLRVCVATTLPAPDPARWARLRALSASPRGAHRTGSSAALRHGGTLLTSRAAARPQPSRAAARPQPAENRLRLYRWPLPSPIADVHRGCAGRRAFRRPGRRAPVFQPRQSSAPR
jgi:hypothetical protein